MAAVLSLVEISLRPRCHRSSGKNWTQARRRDGVCDCDFAILTVVPEAWEAAKELFGVEHYEEREGLVWGVCLVQAEDGGKHVISIGRAVDRSNVPANEAASAMLRAWKPRHLVLADIGGGFWGEGPKDRDGLDLGDVVVANDIQYFEAEKQTEAGRKLRDYSIQLPSVGPRSALLSLRDRYPEWHQPAQQFRPADGPDRPPQILDGQIVCGEKLLANPKSALVKRLVRTYDKALALDMESVGVGRAVLERQREEISAQFTVLRGISDLFDKDEPNQQTRDDWKPFAARAAVAAAYAWIVRSSSDKGVIAKRRPLPKPLASLAQRLGLRWPASKPTDPADEYIEKTRKWLKDAAPIAERDFRLALQTTDLRSVPSAAPAAGATVERGELLGLVLQDRKVVVIGPSGAGKSNLLRQVLRQVAVQDEPLVVYLDLKENWNPDWASGLVEIPNQATIDASMDALLTASVLDVSTSDLNNLLSEQQLLLIVDALNEVPTEIGQRIRRTLNEYVRRHPTVYVLASDRRRELFYRESRWTVLHLSGATKEEARDVVDDRIEPGKFDQLDENDQKLLCVPFFLDRALRSGHVRLGSRANAVNDFLRDGGLDDNEIELAAPVAFDVYRRRKTVLNKENETALEQEGILKTVRDAAIVIDGASGPIFGHQLVHQFLAGRYLGAHAEEWTAETLDNVTADSASLETVDMTIAAIEGLEKRDRFLRIVYDWNWYAAMSALIETQTGDNRRVSDALATALLALAAEKRFDPVMGTRKRVNGLLAEVAGVIAEEMRAVASRDELLRQVSETDFPDADWWTSWRDVFVLTPGGHELADEDLALIGSSEPLIGWTVANALRRFSPSDLHSSLLQAIYRSQRRDEPGARVTRWRVVHALGAWPTLANANLLLETLDTDEYTWVLYGAVRSLVEMAARTTDHDLRNSILRGLDARWAGLTPEPLRQLVSAAAYRDADGDWPNAVRPLLNAIRDAQTGGEREFWDRRLETFEDYACAHVV
jgi:nucleoside phosphorylase